MAIDFSKYITSGNTQTATKSRLDFSKYVPKGSTVSSPNKPKEPKTVYLLGGGVLKVNPDNPFELIKTDRSNYGGVKVATGLFGLPYAERADVVPVSLGGVNSAKENIVYEKYPLVERAKDLWNKIKGKTYVPQTRTDKYLKEEILPAYKSGEITLREAQGKAVSFLRDEQEGLNSAQTNLGILKNTLTKFGTDLYKIDKAIISLPFTLKDSIIEQFTKPEVESFNFGVKETPSKVDTKKTMDESTSPYKLSGETTISQAPEYKPPLGFIGKTVYAAYKNVDEMVGNASAKLNDLAEALLSRGATEQQKANPLAPSYIKEDTSASKVFAQMISAGVGNASLGFLPITVQFEAAKEIPIIKYPAKAFSKVFEVGGEIASNVGGKFVDELPISDEEKNNFRQPVSDLFGFVGQFGVAKGVHIVSKSGVKSVDYLPIKEGTKAKIQTGIQLGTGLSMTPFSTIYGSLKTTANQVEVKVQERVDEGIEITPKESKIIVDEVLKENGIDKANGQMSIDDITIGKATQAKGVEVEPLLQEAKTSGVAKSIEAKAVEQGLIEKGFDKLAEYEGSTFKEQVEKVSELVKDMEKAKAIVRGDELLPSDIKSGAFLAEMERYAKKTKDADLQYELANSKMTSKISESASELSFARMREKDSATIKLQEVKKALQERADKTNTREVAKVKNEIKNQKKVKLSKEEASWDKFLDEVIC